MAAIETVLVERKDHPNGWVRVNKDSVKPDDVVYGQQKKTETQKHRRATVKKTK